MSDEAATSHIEGECMDSEQETEVQINEFELTNIRPSNDLQEFSFAPHDGYALPNLDDISPSISWSVFSTTGHNITDVNIERIIDDYQMTERPFASRHESEPVSNVTEIFPPIPQSSMSTQMSDEMQINLEEINYYPETERPFAAHDRRYPMSNLTEGFPSFQSSVCSTPTRTEMPSFEKLIDDDRASTSFGNLCASAGPSDGRDLVEQCEPLGAEAHRRPGDWYFVCPGCERSCRRWNEFSIHLRIHTNEFPYTCNICDWNFRSIYKLRTHLRTHHGEKPFLCDLCVEKFFKKDELNRHRRTHTV